MTDNTPNTDEPYEWIWVDATYLRELAQRCAALARDCPHTVTSHQLEAIAVELMQKAAELDDLQKSDCKGCLTVASASSPTARPK